jgi:E3 ubiquitin-protein ligase UBR7
MFQCVGLGNEGDGGCGEDWWHPECIAGLSRDWHMGLNGEAAAEKAGDEHEEKPEEDKQEESDDPPVPPGFPNEDDFEAFICYKCVESNPWIKRYAGSVGFLKPFFKKQSTDPTVELDGHAEAVAGEHSQVQESATPHDAAGTTTSVGNKRKFEDNAGEDAESTISKRVKENGVEAQESHHPSPPTCKYESLPLAPTGTLSLFCKEEFRDHICHCPTHFPLLRPYPQLLDEEEIYEPPVSESGDGDGASGARSHGTGSLLDRGEAALSNVDRVRAIEGVMVYNHLRDKVKAFLQPFAESGQPVGAEDIKKYFEKLRGDEEGIKAAAAEGKDGGGGGDNRREERGK